MCKNIPYHVNICKNLQREVRAPTICLSAFKQTSGHNYFNPERTVIVLKNAAAAPVEDASQIFCIFLLLSKQISS